MELPERMRHLERRGPYPVPPIFGRDDNGVPDFTVIDPEQWARIVGQKRCAMCGEPLDYWIYFIGGPRSVGSGQFFDPAMHEECARYAMATCPFLAMGKSYATRPAREGAGERSDEDPGRPDRFAFYITRKYRVRGAVIKAAPAKRIEWVD